MLIQAARYGKLLRKLISFVGPEPSLEVPEFIIPGIILENDRLEYGVLRRELPWIWQDSLAAVVGNFTAVGVSQSTPGMITVVKSIVISNNTGAAGNFQIRLLNNVVNDVLASVFGRDTRSTQLVNGNTSTQRFRRTQVAAPGTVVLEMFMQAGDSKIIPVDFVLSVPVVGGGSGVVGVTGALVNTAVDASFWGYERNAEPYEIE